MFARLKSKEYEAGKGDVNRERMRTLVDSGANPGLLYYIESRPVGWISLGPRNEFPRWANSKVLAPVDDKPVWVIVCQFIAKEYRRKGISVELLLAASDYARAHGATILEGYPTDSKGKKQPDPWVWTGLYQAYIRAGFVEVARRSATHPIMRLNMEAK